MARLEDYGLHNGDIVVVTEDCGMRGFIKAGTTGTVISGRLQDGYYIRVQLDMYDGRLHSCDHLCERGRGYNFAPGQIKPFVNEDNFELPPDDIFALLGVAV